jgi:hypothetical protein
MNLVSQKATPGRITEIIYNLGKRGGVTMSERGGYERKYPTSRQVIFPRISNSR